MLLLFQHPYVANAELPQPDRWDQVMRAFETEDAASTLSKNTVVFTGSSSIAFWKTLEQDMAPLSVINRGFGGSTMRDVFYWLDIVVLKHRPRAIVLYVGDNDIGLYNSSPDEVLAGFEDLVSRIRRELPSARIYFVGIKPSISRWAMWPNMQQANRLIQAFCERTPNVRFVDIASPMLDSQGRPNADFFEPDGLHMNTRGYCIWTSVIRPILLESEGLHQPELKHARTC